MNKQMKTLALVAAAATSLPASAGVMTYDNLTDWTAAVGSAPLVMDGFDNDMAQVGNAALTFDSGVISTNAGGSPCCGDNGIEGGTFDNAVDGNGDAASLTNTWNFNMPIIGFAFDFFSMESSTVITIDGEVFSPNAIGGDLFAISGGLNGFAGFVSDTAFSTVVFSDTDNLLDEYDIDNLVFAKATSSVPEPGTLALLSLGLLGLVTQRRATR